MHWFWVIVSIVSGLGIEPAQVPVAADLRETLATVAKEREAKCVSWKMVEPADLINALNEPSLIVPDVEPEARRYATPFSYLRLDGLDVTPYRQAIVSALQDSDPKIRGLACEVATLCWDTELIAPLGALLDDEAQACPIEANFMRQQMLPAGSPVPRSTGCRPPVRYLARRALCNLVGIRFDDGRTFKLWLDNNGEPQTKLWYWQAKWRHRWEFSIGELVGVEKRLAALRAAEAKPALDDSFQMLDRGLQLRILSTRYLFDEMDGKGPLSLELARDVGGTLRSCRVWSPTIDEGALPKDVGAYLKRNGFAKELLDLLTDPELAKDPADPQAVNMARFAAQAGHEVLQAADEAVLAGVQSRSSLPRELKEELALLRAKLSPNKAASILTAYLGGDPESWRCLGALSRLGSEAGTPLVDLYWRSDESERDSIAMGLVSASELKAPLNAPYILRFLIPPTPTDEKPAASTVMHLAAAARAVVGQDVADPEDLEELASWFWKGPTKRSRATTREEAGEKVRLQLIAGLRARSNPRAK